MREKKIQGIIVIGMIITGEIKWQMKWKKKDEGENKYILMITLFFFMYVGNLIINYPHIIIEAYVHK